MEMKPCKITSKVPCARYATIWRALAIPTNVRDILIAISQLSIAAAVAAEEGGQIPVVDVAVVDDKDAAGPGAVGRGAFR